MYFNLQGKKFNESRLKCIVDKTRYYWPLDYHLSGQFSTAITGHRTKFEEVDGVHALHLEAATYAYLNSYVGLFMYGAGCAYGVMRDDGNSDTEMRLFAITHDYRWGDDATKLSVTLLPGDRNVFRVRANVDGVMKSVDTIVENFDSNKWFELAVQFEGTRVELRINNKSVMNHDFGPGDLPATSYCYFGGRENYNGFYLREVSLFPEILNDEEMDTLHEYKNKIIDEEFKTDDRYAMLPEGRVLRAYPFQKNSRDMITGDYLTYEGSLSGFVVDTKYCRFNGGKMAVKNLPINDDTEAVTISMSLGNLYRGALFGIGSQYLYFNYNYYFGFSTGKGDVYGVAPNPIYYKNSHIIVVFRKGSYGDIYVDGIKQELTHKGAIPDSIVNTLGNELVVNGRIGTTSDSSYVNAYNMKIIEGEVTDEEAMDLFKEEWPENREVGSYVKAIQGGELECGDYTEKGCITASTASSDIGFWSKHILEKVKSHPFAESTAVDIVNEKVFQILNEVSDGSSIFSLDIDALPEFMYSIHNGEAALVSSEATLTYLNSRNDINMDSVRSIYARIAIDDNTVFGFGSSYPRVLIKNKVIIIEWDDSEYHRTAYPISGVTDGDWADVTIVFSVTGVDHDRVVVNGDTIYRDYSLYAEQLALLLKERSGKIDIGSCKVGSEEYVPNARISRLEIFCTGMGLKNIENIVSGLEYNHGMSKDLIPESKIYMDGENIFGMFKGLLLLPYSSRNSPYWEHEPVEAIAGEIPVLAGIRAFDRPNKIRDISIGKATLNGAYRKVNPHIGNYAITGNYGGSISITENNLTPNKDVYVYMDLIICEYFYLYNLTVRVTVGTRSFVIEPPVYNGYGIDNIDSLLRTIDEVVDVKPTPINLENSGRYYEVGEMIVTLKVKANTGPDGNVYMQTKLISGKTEYYGAIGLSNVSVCDIEDPQQK